MNIQWKIPIGYCVLSAAGFSCIFGLSCYSNKPKLYKSIDLLSPSSHIPDRSPPSSVDRLLNEMDFGAIAFNVPTEINIDDVPQIQLILSLADSVEELKQTITEQGEILGVTIKVSDRMEARLSGYMFQITAITPEQQAVSKTKQTEWKWEIHPKEQGRHKLHLTITVLLEIDGESTPRAIRSFDKLIQVNVTATQKLKLFFNRNWEWLLLGILVPFAPRHLKRIWKWLRSRIKKEPTNTSS